MVVTETAAQLQVKGGGQERPSHTDWLTGQILL